jgi:CubicO group peptidase (beta-lactamase class C family)
MRRSVHIAGIGGVPWRAAVLVAMLVALAVPWAASAAAATEVDPARLDRFLGGGLAAAGMPGTAAAVTASGQIRFERGYGSAGPGQPVTPRTRFLIGSLSKSFTAVAVLQLADAGRLDIDRPVQTYLPEFRTADPVAARRITVRHLLNHTSGLADAGFAGLNETMPDLRARVSSLREARSGSEPGQAFHYFEPNYQVLARLVEVVSGQPFGAYLHDRVFGPLGMTDTVAVATTAEAARLVPTLAQGHVLVFGALVARAELDGLLAGSAGVVSTSQDMARWLVLHTTGAGPEGQRLLDPALVELTHTPPPGVDGGYGMGWQVIDPADGPRRIEHTGVLSTFSAVQVLLPGSGHAFVLLHDANSAFADTAGVTAGLATLLDGGEPAGVRPIWTTAALLGGLTVGVAAVRTAQVLRAPRWVRRRPSWWRVAAGTVWLLVPVAVLFAMPALMLALIGRRFTFWQLALAMPDLIIFLSVAAVGGVALTGARLAALRHASP